MAKSKERHVICRAAEVAVGERKIVQVGKRSIGVFNVDGAFHAIANVCPHQLAPLCRGTLAITAYGDSPDEWQWDETSCVIRCPWHGWEFDIRTGRSVFNPHRVGVPSYEIALEPLSNTDSSNTDSSNIDSSNTNSSNTDSFRTVSTDEADPVVEVFDVAIEMQTNDEQIVVLYI